MLDNNKHINICTTTIPTTCTQHITHGHLIDRQPQQENNHITRKAISQFIQAVTLLKFTSSTHVSAFVLLGLRCPFAGNSDFTHKTQPSNAYVSQTTTTHAADVMKSATRFHPKFENLEISRIGTKKTISSSYICPADGSQYKQSAVGLVFMESAAGLAMETSKVESAKSALMSSQSAVGNQQTKKAAGALSIDDISSDVIIQHVATVISRKLSTDEKSSAKVSHTVEAVVHLRSLGVLTAAGCGIGSVHEVVRSNLLVEPSEVEEGEM
ncbi:hypothetical protein F511_40774 [Dorcoceras hygrometricum]|uniref:Uncharacterized protein n=1 Tax=Dorcoceras hygrometricum TaxID=472368 RepID=A0A2Z7AFY3_9LAMI|nr:hypothetical protein F511_40774 [Dorcoceras hygrometricum]